MPGDPAALKEYIQDYLDNSLLAVVAWTTAEGPDNGLFLFGNDASGRLFIRTRKGSRLERAVQEDPRVSLLVYREEETLEPITTIRAAGRAVVVTDPETVQEAYRQLRRKSPALGQARLQEEEAAFTILAIGVTEFRKHQYKDYLNGTPPAVLRRRVVPPA